MRAKKIHLVKLLIMFVERTGRIFSRNNEFIIVIIFYFNTTMINLSDVLIIFIWYRLPEIIYSDVWQISSITAID